MRIRKLLTDNKHIAFPNGVCLKSNKHQDWYAIAWYDEKAGKVSTMWEKKKELSKMRAQIRVQNADSIFYNRIKKIIAFLVVLNLILAFIVFAPVLTLIKLIFFLPFLLCPICILHFTLLAFLMTAEEKKYHGALHMLLNSWCKGVRVQYVRSLKLFSRFYSSCKTGRLIYIIILCFFSPCVLYSGLSIADSFWVILTLALLLDVLKGLGLFNIFQRFTTLPATDKEAAVVLAAAKLLLEKEDE